MEEFASQNNLEYHYEKVVNKNYDSYIRFYLTNVEWEGKIEISFDFEEGSYYYGVCNNLEKYQLSPENKAILHQRLEEKGIPIEETQWYPFYENIDNLTVEVWETNIVKNDTFFKSCTQKIEILLDALKGLKL